METDTMNRLAAWIESEFGDGRIARETYVERAASADLPADAKKLIQDIPAGHWSKRQVVEMVRDREYAMTGPTGKPPTGRTPFTDTGGAGTGGGGVHEGGGGTGRTPYPGPGTGGDTGAEGGSPGGVPGGGASGSFRND